MSYIDSLTAEQKLNISLLIMKMKAKGITNQFMQAGILAVVSKESGFKPKSETSYAGTDNSRIRMIFSRTKKLTDPALTALKENSLKFFNFIYDGIIGNKPGEGYKFRGRGFNQVTGRANYEALRPYTSIDIVTNPEALNEPEIAAEALIGYFLIRLNSKVSKLSLYGVSNWNQVISIEKAIMIAYHANAGWGKTSAQINADPTGGLRLAKSRVADIYAYLLKTFPA